MKEHYIFDLHQINEELFRKLAKDAHSCINNPHLAKILDVDYNPEPIQLRPGDSVIKVLIKGGKLLPYNDELPENVVLEFYCYSVYSPSTHVIIEKNEIQMEE